MLLDVTLNPYIKIADVPAFTVVSSEIFDGCELPLRQRSGIFGAGGTDTSPHLSWEGFPSKTKSFAVTVMDPAAPTGSGFWHWALFNIPAHVTSLTSGAAANNGAGLPKGSVQLKNDAGFAGFLGAAPPPGSGRHPYYFGIHALDVAVLEVGADATPAFLGFNLSSHTLARAVITPWYAVDLDC